MKLEKTARAFVKKFKKENPEEYKKMQEAIGVSSNQQSSQTNMTLFEATNTLEVKEG